MQSSQGNRAEHLLYAVYWRLCLEDILFHLGFESLQKNAQAKEILHNFHKRLFDIESIADESHEVVSKFIQDVYIFWAVEQGIFVRTNKKQPLYIEMMAFSDTVRVEGKDVKVIDLL